MNLEEKKKIGNRNQQLEGQMELMETYNHCAFIIINVNTI